MTWYVFVQLPLLQFSVFNLGNFDVTVTTYHHLLLENLQNPSGKSSTMIGPILIHAQKDFAAYHFLLLRK